MTERIDHIVLRLENDQVSLSAHSESGASIVKQVSLSNVRNRLQKSSLSGMGVEYAINEIEDLIIPLLVSLPKNSALQIDGPELERVSKLIVSITGDTTVSLDAVENLYRRLADYAAGSPIAWKYELAPEEIALELVLLREVMHHGGFRFVS